MAAASNSFPHDKGDLVLVKWNDGMVYFAKIKRIDYNKKKCIVIFDDRSTDEASFSQIHNVDETTTDIICIKCKKDDSDTPNEIVLCDLCGIGFHQKCHNPPIPASALELNSPWHCIFCIRHVKNPYLTESIDVMQSLFEEDDEEEKSTAATTSQRGTVKVKVEPKDIEPEPTCSRHHHQPHPPPALLQESPPSKKRKGGSKPRSSDNASSRRGGKMRPLEVLRRKLAKTTSGRAAAVASTNRSSNRKRPLGQDNEHRYGSTSPKMSCGTVESHTLSVISSSEPLSTASSALSSAEDEAIDSDSSNVGAGQQEGQPVAIAGSKKPRSLRVSLTLPPSVDTSPVSSTTQKSPPDMLPWKQSTTAEVSSSPEPSLQIRLESDDTAGSNTVAVSRDESQLVMTAIQSSKTNNNSTDDESVLCIDLDNSNNYDDVNSNQLPVDATKRIDSSTQTIERSPPKEQSPATENISKHFDTAKSSNADSSDDVIIIDDNLPLKCKVPSPTKPSCKEKNISAGGGAAAVTDTAATQQQLVKVVPGVTSLMPRKTSVIQQTTIPSPSVSTPSPTVSTPSPLEQLQMQIKQANQLNKMTQYSRRNSFQNTAPVQRRTSSPIATNSPATHNFTNPLTTSAQKKGGTTPLTHIDAESCNEHFRKPNPPTVPSSSSVPSTQYSVPAAPSKETVDEVAFNRDMISATRSRKPITPPAHYKAASSEVNRRPPVVHQERSSHHQRKPSSSTRILQHPLPLSNNPATTTTTNNNYITAAAVHSPAITHPSNTTVGNITGSQTVVVTPTTITATGEVATVYTLVHPEQQHDTNTIQYSSSHSDVSYRPIVLTQQAPPVPTQITSIPIQDPTPQSMVPYYTIMEINDSSSTAVLTHQQPQPQTISHHHHHHHPAAAAVVANGPTINTTKPYAIVNAIPTNQPPPPPPPLRSPPASLNIPPPTSTNKRKKTAPITITSPPPPYSTPVQQRQSPHLIQNKQPVFTTQKELVSSNPLQETNTKLIRESDNTDISQQLYRIKSKKDFDNISEENLLELFQSAVKQFRDNGRKYEALIGKRLPPPNVEVIDDSGTVIMQHNTSRIIRPKARRLVSHVAPAALRKTSPPSNNNNNNITTATNYQSSSSISTSAQQKLVYQTSGVFVPPPSEEVSSTTPQTFQKAPPPPQQIIYNQQRRLLPHNNNTTAARHTTQQQQQRSISQQKLSYSPSSTQYSVGTNTPQNRQIVKDGRTYIITEPSSAGHTTMRHPIPTTTTTGPNRPQQLQVTNNVNISENDVTTKKKDRICSPCGKNASFLCSGCHNEWYCSSECQLNAWDQHSHHCKAIIRQQ